jgi:hypothetical protein
MPGPIRKSGSDHDAGSNAAATDAPSEIAYFLNSFSKTYGKHSSSFMGLPASMQWVSIHISSDCVHDGRDVLGTEIQQMLTYQFNG